MTFWILAAVEDSLRRLQTDWIDLYQVHRPDPATDLEETPGALTDLVRAGKDPRVRLLDLPARGHRRGLLRRQRHGLMRFRTEQPPYSMLARRIETSVLPVCPRLGMGVLTWSPLAWGFLSGKYGTGRDPDVTAARPALARTASIRHGRPTRPSSRPPGSSLTRPVSARPA